VTVLFLVRNRVSTIEFSETTESMTVKESCVVAKDLELIYQSTTVLDAEQARTTRETPIYHPLRLPMILRWE
jgi:hypothetical protein